MACFKQASHFFQAQVIAVNTNTITIDRPFDFTFTTNATVTRTTKEMNVVIRLDPALNDELQFIIQDNLTALTEFHCIALGHVVAD